MAKSMIYVSEGGVLADILSIPHYVSSPVFPTVVSEPDPRKIEKEGLVNGVGWKCTGVHCVMLESY